MMERVYLLSLNESLDFATAGQYNSLQICKKRQIDASEAGTVFR